MEPIIETSGLSKVYRADVVATHAVREVALRIWQGEFVSITGTSGCGKSTLLSLLGLLETPTYGSYRLGGNETTSLTERQAAWLRNHKLGFVFQSFNLVGHLTAQRNVMLPFSFRKGGRTVEARAAADRALEEVGLGSRRHHYPAQLSGGEQQRVAIARAVVTNPAVILADEPTGNLDSASGDRVVKLLHALNAQGTTVCMVTHDTEKASEASRVCHMCDGCIVDAVESTRRGAQEVSG